MKKLGILAALAAMFITPSAEAYNRRMGVTNLTGETAYHLWASASTDNSWGPDQLGMGVLSHGETIVINFEDGYGTCVFDLKIETANAYYTKRRVNVCELMNVTFRD